MEIKDKDYYNELRREIRLKTMSIASQAMQLEMLSHHLECVENGMTRKELKEQTERNPFNDFKLFGGSR